MIAYADIEYTTEQNDDGYDCDCVYATCRTTGCRIGPIWGQHDRSIQRALATLSEECDCGGFHQQPRQRAYS